MKDDNTRSDDTSGVTDGTKQETDAAATPTPRAEETETETAAETGQSETAPEADKAAPAAPAANPAPAAAAPAAPATGGDAESSQASGEPSKPASAPSGGPMNFIVSLLAILAVVAGLWYALERTGVVPTSVLTSTFGHTPAETGENRPVAVVNGTNITASEFNEALEQNLQAAQQQGADPNNPQIMATIESQALDSLINSELLRQAALGAEISVSEEDIDARITEIEAELGGAEELAARMEEIGIDMATLREDIENELLIQTLLESELELDAIVVNDEDVTAFYEQAGGEEGGLPPLADVEEQIESQLRLQEEQQLVQEFLSELRNAADIEVLLEESNPTPSTMPPMPEGVEPPAPEGAAAEGAPAAEGSEAETDSQ